MLAPVSRLKKAQIVWLANHLCRHQHTYLNHYQCYLNECKRPGEKIGFLDIESSNLNADYGFIISYCIKPQGSMNIIQQHIKKSDLRDGYPDRSVISKLIRDLQKFDRFIVYYGSNGRFDIPFIRSRAMLYGIPFPPIKTKHVTDLYPIVKNKLKLHSNRLQCACDFLGIEAKNYPMRHDVWVRAMVGDKAAIDYIVEHNIEDVVCLEELYDKLFPHLLLQESTI